MISNPRTLVGEARPAGTLTEGIGEQTPRILEPAWHTARGRRGWLLRRLLLVADVVSLVTAMFVAEAVVNVRKGGGVLDAKWELVALVASLPGWIVIAKLYGLYDRDEERTDHATAAEFSAVFHMVTVCAFLFWACALLANVVSPTPPKLIIFWASAIVLVPTCRGLARAAARHSSTYLQNTVIVGAGDVGQLVARKLLQHPEYGINVVGFVDAEPKERGPGLDDLTLLGGPRELPRHHPALRRRARHPRFLAGAAQRHAQPHQRAAGRRRAGGRRASALRADSARPRVHQVEGVPLLSLPPFSSLARRSC